MDDDPPRATGALRNYSKARSPNRVPPTSEKPVFIPSSPEPEQHKKTTNADRILSDDPDAIPARGFEDVKMEPLTDDMTKRTMFLVTAHNSPKGPVPVPFTECGNFRILFPTLIKERGISDEDAEKIDSMTTIFSWTGGEQARRLDLFLRQSAQSPCEGYGPVQGQM